MRLATASLRRTLANPVFPQIRKVKFARECNINSKDCECTKLKTMRPRLEEGLRPPAVVCAGKGGNRERRLFVVDQLVTISTLQVTVARDEDILVAAMPGLAMRRIADLLACEAKTDAPPEAAIIAEIARSILYTLRSLRLADEPSAEQKVLCRFEDDLAAQITGTSNRIRASSPQPIWLSSELSDR